MAKIVSLHPEAEITEEQQIEALQAISRMTPEQKEELLAFAEEFEQMSEEEKDLMQEFLNLAAIVPEDERENFLKDLLQLDDTVDEDDQEEKDTEYDYTPFLSRGNVQKYTLRVTLKGIKPAIYRKFNVPSNISLRHLSELLLELMGWMNEHLNQFRKYDRYYAPAYQREHEMPVLFGPARNYNQEDYTISDLLNEKGKSIEWEYDFGDSWLHEVKLSSIGEYKEGEPLVSFVKGARECPPEDCGGIWGYQSLLELYAKKESGKKLSDEEEDRLDWYDMTDDFDPDYFDTDFAEVICEDYCE